MQYAMLLHNHLQRTEKKVTEIFKNHRIIFGSNNSGAYFCAPITGLTHGVTVALQILVLSVKVRILMGQHRKVSIFADFFYAAYFPYWHKKKNPTKLLGSFLNE